MNIYVGNLSPNVSKEDLEPLFAAFGKVDSVAVIKECHYRREREGIEGKESRGQ
jgi:RNA recognition motif-containing protein